MKYKFLVITGDWAYGKMDITKQDLGAIKQKTSDCLIDIEAGKYYDATNNLWYEIEGEKVVEK